MMIKNRKVLFIFALSLLLIGLIFFVGQKMIQFNKISKEIVNSLKENNFEEAINLINQETSFKENISFLPIIGREIELRQHLKKIDNNLKEINNGFLLSSMLQQDKNSLFYLENINESLNYLDKYNIDYIKDKKNYLQNWFLFFGNNKPKNYLVLFQEPAMPRSTGGFIGAYAILTFDKGKIEFSGNNIFTLEEIFLEKIIPPDPLQSISDKWSFHDSNWFFDYPSSAQKMLSFYSSTEKKPLLDGVIVVNFPIISDVLEVIGPITINDHDLIIDYNNCYSFFKNQIQEGAKPAPMREEQELFSVFLEALQTKLRKASTEVLSKIPDVLENAFIKKEIQLYVIDDKLEYFFDSLNWTGRIEESQDNYLAVVFNLFNQNFFEDIRSKEIKLKTEFISGGQIINTLIINVPPYDSTDRLQETYLKIYIPKGITIKGTENCYLKKNENTLSYYKKLGYKEDEDLSLIAKTKIRNENLGIEIYEEGGKTVIATWTKLSAKPFKLVYKLSNDWTDFSSWGLKVQKQSGQDVKFSYQLVMPDEVKIIPTLFPFNELIPLESDMMLNFKREY
ncbi:MAG TPA: DUF4012 domain-containing protein [Candidatus Paceibacterota bacterium]|nr:DUF4012 domain-containing protein [Candidatus Paceibacterota bacterium]